MATYNMSEFRANLAEAFNRVAEGEAVYISRGNQQFRLTARASRKPKKESAVAEPEVSTLAAAVNHEAAGDAVAKPAATKPASQLPADVDDMDLPEDVKEMIRQSREEYARGEYFTVSTHEELKSFLESL